jgi:hypothetical protein
MHIGYDNNTGHVYQGANSPEFAVVPPPLLTLARLVESPADLQVLPRDLHQSPLDWVFREASFDPVTRIRRGLLFEPFPAGQPDSVLTRGHLAHQFDDLMRRGSLTKQLFHFWPCTTLLNRPRAGHGMKMALGQSTWSMWRIVQVERVVGDDVLITLKALSAFNILPELRYEAIDEQHRPSVQRAIERVLDSAFRETAISIIDQCRNAAVVLLGRWMASHGASETSIGPDLGKLVHRIRAEPFQRFAVAAAAEMVNLLHPRGKANEQETKGYRLAQEEDAEAAVHAIGFIMRELGWAE